MANFEIYKASAGSGKTYTLVKEYIKRSLSNTNTKISHKSLLAITFTNKAAREMKTRIVDSLFQFSRGIKNIEDVSCKKMYNDLKIELEYNDLELIENSKKVLFDIIHYYRLFSVSTIDQFIHKIIRGFTYELDLPSNFEVEMENEKIIQESVLSLLDELVEGDSLTKNLIKYSSYKTKENKNWDIEEDLLSISKQLFKENTFKLTEGFADFKLIKEKQKNILVWIRNFEKRIDLFSNQIQEIIKGVPEDAFIYKDLPNYLNKIKKKPYVDILVQKRLREAIDNNNWYKKNETEINKKTINNISAALCEKLIELIDYIDTDYSKYLFYRECYSSLFLVAVLSEINKQINKIKEKNNIIHISEFNQLIFNCLEKSPAPFIYEKTGNRYAHYFIDEFQDTSTIQWNNLVPLLEEALSNSGTCLIVGDGKQSIYRWRGGEVSQFLKLCDQNKKHQLSQFSKTIKSLKINYRSGGKIVDFNNRFFSHLSKELSDPYVQLYKTLNQKTHHCNKGYVELSVLASEGTGVIDDTLKKIQSYIMETINDSFSFSDIVILTRSNKEITTIATHLTEHGVPIISSESLLLRSSLTIQFLINNMIVISDELDYLSKAKLIEHLLSCNIIKSEQTSKHQIISRFSKTNSIDFEQFLCQYDIEYNINNFKHLSVYELAETLIRLFRLDQSPNLYINFFLDFIFEFSITHGNSINDFLNFWNQKKNTASIVIPSGINAVEIMTIHKSKGLQFPVVIFPFANWKEDLGKDKKWFNIEGFQKDNKFKRSIPILLPLKKELEGWPAPFPVEYLNHKKEVKLDNINLLYVAMTRPKDRLYVISNSDSKKGGVYKYFESFINNKRANDSPKNKIIEGEKTKKQSTKLPPNSVENIYFISQPWRSRLSIRKNRDFNNKLVQKYSIYWGDLIHEIMAKIKTKLDITLTLKKLDIEKKYGPQTFKRIKLEINRIITNPKIAHLFKLSSQTFSETNILSLDGKIYRPDRVIVESKNVASLIDYKTGKEKKSHYNQMKQYEAILLQLGYKKINKYLIYLTTGDIKKI